MSKRGINILLILLAFCVITSCGVEGDKELDSKKAIKLINKYYEIDVSGMVEYANGVKTSNATYIEIKVNSGDAANLETIIKNKYGDGKSPDNKTLPRADNSVCKSLNSKNISRIYTIFSKGKHGAKTSEKLIYLGEKDGEMFLFFIY